mgnify:CR=1 FL=1
MIGQKGIPALYGGVERHVAVLSLHLSRAGHTVTVYARKWYSGGRVMGKEKHITRVVLPSIHTQHLDTVTHVAFSLFHALFLHYDVIHLHGVGPALLAWMPRLFNPRARVVVTVHSLNREHPQWNAFDRVILRMGEWAAVHFAHKTIVVSNFLRTYFRREYGRDTTVIPNGIEMPARVPASQLLLRWQIESKRYAVFIGRLVEGKGVHTLLRAWRRLQKERPEALQGRSLIIVGDESFSRAYVQRLKRLARGDVSIIFTGWQEGASLHALLAHAEVLVQPSLSEGLPLVLLEAMAYGIPVLVSDIPAHREIITEARVRFPVDDDKTLAARIAELLTDHAWHQELGRENQERVRRKYQWKRVTEQTIAMYHA